MKNLFLHILCMVSIFLVFRFFKKYNVNPFHAIVINYFVCMVIGINFLSDKTFLLKLPYSESWVQSGVLIGALFLPSFYLMCLTVEKVSVSVATVSNKMSLIVPVLFSLAYIQKGPDHFSFLNLTGILFALIAIILTSYRKATSGAAKINKRTAILLPLSIFLAGGIIDTLINYTNHNYLHGSFEFIFPLIMFSTACLTGIIILIIKFSINREFLSWKDFTAGLLLGIPNYFSLYFLIKTLSDFQNNGAIVFPVINIGVIVIASLSAVILFKERLSRINLSGICLSMVSIVLLFW